MAVVFFYAVLIGGLALAAAAYLALLIAPAVLIFVRFGVPAGVAYTIGTLGVLWTTYEPPYGGRTLAFVPAGMRPNLFIVGTLQEPPIAMLVATAVISGAALVVLLISWILGRQVRPHS